MSLLLTRRTGEAIHIGDDITVTVASIKGPQVCLAIKAPKAIPIHRDEVYRRLQRNAQASTPTPETTINETDASPENKPCAA